MSSHEEEVRVLEAKVQELEERATELEEEVESLEDSVTALAQQVERLEDEKGELEDRVETLQGEKTALEKSLEPHEDLVAALNVFLSWIDHPPAGMPAEGIASHILQFRRDLDDALREVTR